MRRGRGKTPAFLSEPSAQAGSCSLLENGTWAGDKYKPGEEHAPHFVEGHSWEREIRAVGTSGDEDLTSAGFTRVPKRALLAPAQTRKATRVGKPMPPGAGFVSAL